MTETMPALVKDGNSIALKSLPTPKLENNDDVIVQVMLAGLCRTDIYAAEGKIPVDDSLILGHEFSGIITDIASDTANYSIGDRVCVNPLLSCGQCLQCKNQDVLSCQNSQFLGLDKNGCFAGFIKVPLSAIHPLAEGMSFEAAAYAEPVAASLACLKAGIKKEEKGLIYGQNRFSQLMLKILNNYGYENVCLYHPENELENDSFDYAIETAISSKTISTLVKAIRPGGKIVLKSRQPEPVMFTMSEIIKKEPIFSVVNYGSFEEAIKLLASGQLQVDDLIDGIYKLDDYKTVFTRASQSESLKPFFAPWN
jgi:L-iditol 2-dehydrogenase